MSFQGLQERLTALQETTSQLRELIDRLANLRFQPGSVPLGTDEECSVSGELSSEIGQLLRGGLEDQELLLEEVLYLRPEGQEKARLQDGIEKAGHELADHRLAFRKARLAAKKSLEEAQKLERRLILQSYTQAATDTDSIQDVADTEADANPTQRFSHRHTTHQNPQSSLSEKDQQTVGASSNVTNSLRRTHDLIAAELSRSEFAHQTLTESSDALKSLNESYSSLDTMLASSKDLLGTLLRSQKSDTWYLQTAMYMLLVTGAWLVFRRLLYGPIWWLVLFPLRILFGVGSRAGRLALSVNSAAGTSGKADVAGGGGGAQDGQQQVKGLPDESLPTARGGREGAWKVAEDSEGTIDEQVRSAVDEVLETEGIREDSVGGTTEQTKEEIRVKDEL